MSWSEPPAKKKPPPARSCRGGNHWPRPGHQGFGALLARSNRLATTFSHRRTIPKRPFGKAAQVHARVASERQQVLEFFLHQAESAGQPAGETSRIHRRVWGRVAEGSPAVQAQPAQGDDPQVRRARQLLGGVS